MLTGAPVRRVFRLGRSAGAQGLAQPGYETLATGRARAITADGLELGSKRLGRAQIERLHQRGQTQAGSSSSSTNSSWAGSEKRRPQAITEVPQRAQS